MIMKRYKSYFEANRPRTSRKDFNLNNYDGMINKKMSPDVYKLRKEVMNYIYRAKKLVGGDVRDKKTGFYKDFIGITKQAFYDSGMNLYNDVILLDQLGNACMRAGKVFEAGKKLTKIHQNVLVFKRGKDAAQ